MKHRRETEKLMERKIVPAGKLTYAVRWIGWNPATKVWNLIKDLGRDEDF